MQQSHDTPRARDVGRDGNGGHVSAAEVARFGALAERWWNPHGPMAPLHAMNPVRVAWILDAIRTRHGNNPADLLDVGCGAGLAAERLAEAGHRVLGIDAAGETIEVARRHSEGMADPPVYRVATTADLIDEGHRFDAVTALEVIEHVTDPTAFCRDLARLLRPGGVLVMSTLNRTTRSLVTAKFGAEYVLRLLPVGTHDWRKFVTPSELTGMLSSAGLRVMRSSGLTFSPAARGWRISRDLGVNYIVAAQA